MRGNSQNSAVDLSICCLNEATTHVLLAMTQFNTIIHGNQASEMLSKILHKVGMRS